MVEIFHFNHEDYPKGDDLQERFGLRGRNMVELAALKTPIAPGFLIQSSDLLGGKIKEGITVAVLSKAVEKIGKQANKSFNSQDRPLLFKVVISPSIQIGTIRSLHTIGINDQVVKGLAEHCGDEFAYHEYRHFIEEVSTRFLGKKASEFDAVRKKNPKAKEKELCALYRKEIVPDFPQDGFEQLRMVLSDMSTQYLEDPMNEDIEAGMLVQMMVYGNFGKNSYNGSFFSRDIVTGEPRLTGHYGLNEFDTAPDKAKDINELNAKYLKQLQQVATRLEEKFQDIRHIKFVIEEETVWVVEQNPVDAKSTQAEVRTLLDLYEKKLIDKRKLILSIPPAQFQDLLHPVIDHASTRGMKKVVGGIAGSPGAAVGRVCFNTPTLIAEYRRCSLQGINSDLILIMPHTDAEDVEAIELGKAVIASVGGYASHAPVVARSLRKPCLLYSDVQYKGNYALIGGQRVNEFDTISIEVPTYTDPNIWLGKAELVYPDTATNGLEEYIHTIGDMGGKFRVLGTAKSANDVSVALRLGADGIGMLLVDHVIHWDKALEPFQEALLITEPDKRKNALGAFSNALEKNLDEVFKLTQERKISLCMLNGPLTEFLPHEAKERKALFARLAKKYSGHTVTELENRANQMGNVNPMIGLRGSRIGIAYPDIYEAITRAILRSARKIAKGKKSGLELDILIPGVMTDAEMRFLRHGRNIESTVIPGIRTVQEALMAEWKVTEMPFALRVGALIELPAAALMAGHMAKQSDFFCIDTNMLTQTTNGMSYDDLNTFLPAFNQYDILKDNPFQILSMPVKELVGAAVHFGKITRPDLKIGLSGDHGSDPGNIEFSFRVGLNYVSCIPYGVPIAKLAVAQHLLNKGD
ncbi:MAG: PEP-utilizing enzyme [Deltaproteobacteria bacterium]|nr:PEP-utilizing enzyme [Deltaproteobacteria bacterium]